MKRVNESTERPIRLTILVVKEVWIEDRVVEMEEENYENIMQEYVTES